MNTASDNRLHGPATTTSLIGGALWLLAGAAAGLWLLFIVPAYQESFKDLGVPVPGLAAMAFAWSNALGGTTPGQTLPLGWIAWPLWLAGIGVATAYCMTRRSAWAGIALGLAALIGGLSLALVHVLAIYLPMATINAQLQQGGTP